MAGAQKAKSLTELRGLCQSMGAKWAFSDDINALNQKIAARQNDLMPKPVIVPVPVPDDQRLRTRPPSKVSDENMIRTMLQPYVDIGMHLSFDANGYIMRHGERVDTGTLRQAPRVIIGCAARLMGP